MFKTVKVQHGHKAIDPMDNNVETLSMFCDNLKILSELLRKKEI